MGAASSRPSLRPLIIQEGHADHHSGTTCCENETPCLRTVVQQIRCHSGAPGTREPGIHRPARQEQNGFTGSPYGRARNDGVATGMTSPFQPIISRALFGPCRGGSGSRANRSPVLTLIRRCGTASFSVKTASGHAPAPGRQRAVNGFAAGFAHSLKGLAMLIRSATIEAFAGAAAARTIAAAPLPTLAPSRHISSLGLLLLSCP